MKNENFTINEIEQKLKRYCSYQDRCHNEVEKKLKEFDLIEEAKNKILFNLINENYLNESRFSENFVRGKFKIKNWGKIKIVQELKSRNISDINMKTYYMKKGHKNIKLHKTNLKLFPQTASQSTFILFVV